MSTTSVVKASALTVPRVVLKRRFYLGTSLLMGVTAIAGFWPTYFGPLVRGTIDQPVLIHVHATVFVGWLVLFLAQATLAATGRISAHLKLGRLGIAYGVVLIVTGLLTGISRSANRVVIGENAERLLYVAFVDMVLFAGFFGAAIAYRRKPQLHRRLMLVAATTLLVAPVFRLSFLPVGPSRVHARLILWSVPILLAIAHDLSRRQSIHPVYALGIGGLLVRNYTEFLSRTGVWSAFTKWATSLVL
jgi:hypothetical protein